MYETASKALLPWWARLLTLAALASAAYLSGHAAGQAQAGQRHLDYLAAQGRQTRLIAQAQARVVIDTQIKYRDRIHTIYVQGAEIEKQVPVYITAADDARYGVNAGFVRLHDAAWSGEPAGPAEQSDHDPAAVSLAQVADTGVYNATVCRAWREYAIGLKDHYTRLQGATNGPQ